MHLLTQAKNNVAALELKRHLGVCYRTAWLVKHKLMQVMQLREDSRQLTGRVEVDDAYLGAQRSGGKPGRGSENKVPFIAAVQTTEDGRPHLACFAAGPFTKASFEEFMAKSTVLPLTVVSDGLGCFTVTESVGAVHDRTITSGGKGSVKLEQFRAVNTVLGNLRTALSGTYHSVKFVKYAGPRDTVKALAAELDTTETQVVHMALSKLAEEMLPAYEQDAGPLTARELTSVRRVAKKTLPKGKVLDAKSLF